MSTVLTKQEYLNALPNDALRTRIAQLVDSVSVEFHESLFGLLQRFSTHDLERFTELWEKVDERIRSAFVAFVVSGDDPDGRFLAYLDESEDCQEAVDLAFRAHVESLHDLGRSVARAEETLQRRKEEERDAVTSLLCEADRAEDALECLEESLESMASTGTAENTTALKPILDSVHQAMAALGGTRTGLKTLVGK